MNAPLDWSYRVREIPEAGLRETRSASAAEQASVAAALEVVSCEELTARFEIRATGKGHYRLTGKVAAKLTQTCVVTLEPIPQTAEGTFDVEFWPAGSVPEQGEEEVEALGAAEIEPIEHGLIDAGRIVLETLSANVDPYPRKAGAEFQAEAIDDPEASAGGPFAALQKLKDRG
jgi:uncharacterized metal-binding protein YceD (DUF177 family)